MAESGFDPDAGSPAGAQGIAQFMPGTAASYGLRNRLDPVEAIDAEAHLMSDLLAKFGDPQLALAAYNAGPGAVEPCMCVPDYPRPRPTSHASSPCSAAPGRWRCRASRCGWWRELREARLPQTVGMAPQRFG
jgi:soluble lytic murein transglycosylase-like protein